MLEKERGEEREQNGGSAERKRRRGEWRQGTGVGDREVEGME